jgi:hypothetical protein
MRSNSAGYSSSRGSRKVSPEGLTEVFDMGGSQREKPRDEPCMLSKPDLPGARKPDGRSLAASRESRTFYSRTNVMPPEIGSSAPDFELRDSTGVLRRLGQLVEGGPRVLILYRGHW